MTTLKDWKEWRVVKRIKDSKKWSIEKWAAVFVAGSTFIIALVTLLQFLGFGG